MKNSLYWSYNLPLQVHPIHDDPDDDTSPLINTTILNYMPRKGRIEELDLSDVLEEQTRQEFFETAALHFENLAKLMRKAAEDESTYIYYHDEGVEK